MKEIMMMKGARKVVTHCANVLPGEQVLLVTDFQLHGIAKTVAAAAYEITPRVVVVTMPPRSLDGEEPPVCVAAAMKEADVIFTPVSKSITHTNAVRSALSGGARGIMLTAFAESMLISGGLDADFAAIKPVCDWVAERWTEGQFVTITTPGGTHLTASITGRKGNSHPGLAHVPGSMTAVPNIEASISPVEGTAEGMIVIDGSIPVFDIGVVREPVRYRVEKGKIVKIEGGSQAARIASIMAGCHDENVYNIAQLAIGLNPHCRLQGLMLEDEGVYRTCHVGIGTSTLLGGGVKTALHYDAVMWHPTIVIDQTKILSDGILQHPLADQLLHKKA